MIVKAISRSDFNYNEKYCFINNGAHTHKNNHDNARIL